MNETLKQCPVGICITTVNSYQFKMLICWTVIFLKNRSISPPAMFVGEACVVIKIALVCIIEITVLFVLGQGSQTRIDQRATFH